MGRDGQAGPHQTTVRRICLDDEAEVAAERQHHVVVAEDEAIEALQAIAAGETFTSANLGIKRPGGGVAPMAFWTYLGKPAPRAYAADELIEPL